MLRASWVFQTLEADGRHAWDRALGRFVIWCGIAPVFLAGLPANIAVLGGVCAVAASALGCLGVLLFFEKYVREFRKLPFTCSYLPGKQPVWALMVRFAVSAALLAPIAQLFTRFTKPSTRQHAQEPQRHRENCEPDEYHKDPYDGRQYEPDKVPFPGCIPWDVELPVYRLQGEFEKTPQGPEIADPQRLQFPVVGRPIRFEVQEAADASEIS
jgi:hypothetical protein